MPKHLRDAVGQGEVIRTLGCISAKQANRQAWAKRAEIEQFFEDAERSLGGPALGSLRRAAPALTQDQVAELAKRFLRELEAAAPALPLDEEGQRELLDAVRDEAQALSHPDSVEDATLQRAAESFAKAHGIDLPRDQTAVPFFGAIREAWIEHLNRRYHQLQGKPQASFNPAFAAVNHARGGEDIGLTLAQAIDMYIKAPERSGNSASTSKMDRSRLGAMRDLIGGHRAVASITRADVRAYQEQLLLLPAHYTQRLPGKTPQQAIVLGAEAGMPRLSPTSVKRDIQAVKSFFTWAEREEIIDKNPASNIVGPKVAKKSSRRPFTRDELNKLVQATVPAPGKQKGWVYWCTRLCLLQGMRMSEPLGLKVGDIVQIGDVWAIKIQPNEVRTLKTEESARTVPVHPRLIELGLLELIEGRSGAELLFSDLPGGKKSPVNGAQKKLGRIVRDNVTDDPTAVFHSLRHGFRDELLDKDVPHEVQAALGGWTIGGNAAMLGYGSGVKLDRLERFPLNLVHSRRT